MRSSVDTASVSIQNVKKIYGKNKLQENNIIMGKSIQVKTLTKINILEKNNRGQLTYTVLFFRLKTYIMNTQTANGQSHERIYSSLLNMAHERTK